MPWCADVDACLRDLLPSLLLLQGACPDETDRALRLLNRIEPWLHGVCGNVSLQHALDADLVTGGATHALAACAAEHTDFADAYLPHLSVPTLRNFLCGPPEAMHSTHSVQPPTPVTAASCVAFAAAALAVGCTAFARRRRACRIGAALCWAIVVIVALPRMRTADRAVDMWGFYVRDAVTECFHRLGALAPDAVLGDRVVAVSAPRAVAKALYEEMRDLRVAGTSLRAMCGHCSLLASREVVRDFVLDIAAPQRPPPPHPDGAYVLFSVVLPSFAPRVWRRTFAARWEERLMQGHAEVVFASREQAEADVLRSMRAPPRVFFASAALTLGTLWAAVACFQDSYAAPARAAGASLALSLLVMGVVVASLVVGEALCVVCGVPRSPFSLVVVPLCLGTGVDNALILLTAYRRSGRFEHAWPSIFASALTSTCSFAAGLVLAVPHLRSLFLTCIATVASGTALHALVTPSCIRLCVSKREHAQQLTEGPPRQRLLWKPALCVLALLWLVLLPFISPVVSTTDLTFQVTDSSMTRRFMDRTRGAPETSSAAVYALVRTDGANWTRLEDHLTRDLDARVTADWHRAYLASSVADAPPSAWKARSGAQLTFGAFFGKNGTSVLLGAMPKRATTDAAKAAAMRAMHALDEEDVCYASEDYLSSYTMHVVQSQLWKLALLTAAFSTLMGVVIAQKHGFCVFPALLMSYATMTGVVGATHMHMHMLLVAVYLIAPGFLVDFQLHMAFNPDTRSAVLLGAATSVASMTPYVFSHLPGVKEFSICYIGFLVIGLLHAFLATVTRSIDGWDAL